MVQVFDPKTLQIVEISDEEYEEQRAIGKQNAYNLFKTQLEQICKANNVDFRAGVHAVYLLTNPSSYENDVRRLFEWKDAPDFMKQLLDECK